MKAAMMSLVFVGIAVGQGKPKHTITPRPDTPHLTFVKEFVREMIEDEDLKTNAEKDSQSAKTPNEQFSNGIYYSKTSQLELRSQIAMLKSMRLKQPFDTLIPSLTAFYQRQIELH
jgi:hypothetical protein